MAGLIAFAGIIADSDVDRLFTLRFLLASSTATNRLPSFVSPLSKHRFLSWRCKVLNFKP